MWLGKHKCPHCGAEYDVTYSRLMWREKDSANCRVCGKEMASWDSSREPSFRLVKPPDSADS
jgi:uncharacterized protein (DUF983 family)